MVSVWCKVVLSFSLQREGEECWGLVLIRPYMQSFFFDCRGRTKCHGKNSPRISAFAFKYKKNKDAASASSQCKDTLGKNANNTWQNRCFSLPYYFFINFWFLKIQGTFSTFMLCFVELWSHCYSHMYKYDTVFPWRIAWAIIIFFAQ